LQSLEKKFSQTRLLFCQRLWYLNKPRMKCSLEKVCRVVAVKRSIYDEKPSICLFCSNCLRMLYQQTGISNLHKLQKIFTTKFKNHFKNVNVYYQRLLTLVIYAQ